jgi:hypothetical protein
MANMDPADTLLGTVPKPILLHAADRRTIDV